MASINEILQDFTRLVGSHDVKDKQPVMNELVAPKGQWKSNPCVCGVMEEVLVSTLFHPDSSVFPLSSGLSRQSSQSDSEPSASVLPEHSSSLSCGDQPLQPVAGLPPLPHRSDQLVPDGSSKDLASRRPDTDFEALRQAISQWRTERQAKQQQHLIDSHTDCMSDPPANHLPDPAVTSPPSGQVGPTESVQLTHGRKAVAATLDLIHSALHAEPEVQEKVGSRTTPPAERQKKATAAGKTEDHKLGTRW